MEDDDETDDDGAPGFSLIAQFRAQSRSRHRYERYPNRAIEIILSRDGCTLDHHFVQPGHRHWIRLPVPSTARERRHCLARSKHDGTCALGITRAFRGTVASGLTVLDLAQRATWRGDRGTVALAPGDAADLELAGVHYLARIAWPPEPAERADADSVARAAAAAWATDPVGSEFRSIKKTDNRRTVAIMLNMVRTVLVVGALFGASTEAYLCRLEIWQIDELWPTEEPPLPRPAPAKQTPRRQQLTPIFRFEPGPPPSATTIEVLRVAGAKRPWRMAAKKSRQPGLSQTIQLNAERPRGSYPEHVTPETDRVECVDNELYERATADLCRNVARLGCHHSHLSARCRAR